MANKKVTTGISIAIIILIATFFIHDERILIPLLFIGLIVLIITLVRTDKSAED